MERPQLSSAGWISVMQTNFDVLLYLILGQGVLYGGSLETFPTNFFYVICFCDWGLASARSLKIAKEVGVFKFFFQGIDFDCLSQEVLPDLVSLYYQSKSNRRNSKQLIYIKFNFVFSSI